MTPRSALVNLKRARRIFLEQPVEVALEADLAGELPADAQALVVEPQLLRVAARPCRRGGSPWSAPRSACRWGARRRACRRACRTCWAGDAPAAAPESAERRQALAERRQPRREAEGTRKAGPSASGRWTAAAEGLPVAAAAARGSGEEGRGSPRWAFRLARCRAADRNSGPRRGPRAAAEAPPRSRRRNGRVSSPARSRRRA